MSFAKTSLFAFFYSVWAACLLAVPASADDLDRFKAENEIKAQKLTADVKAALTRSSTLQRTDPAKARELLRQVQGRLEDDVILPEKQRMLLLQQVRERLRLVIQAVRAREVEDEATAQKAAARVRDSERQAQRDIRKERTPSDIARDRYDAARAQDEAALRLKMRRERGTMGALGSIDESFNSGLAEQRITKHFIEATDRRMKKLSKKEQTLLKALNSVMSVDFNNSPFKDVIDYLQERTGQAIIIDDGSMREAMVEKDDPVTFKAKKIQFRTILRKVLADKGLTYVIREGTLQVVTPQKARDLMIVRTYPVGDLVTPIQPVGPWMNLWWSQANAQMLINQIKSTVDPSIWEQGGTISYNPALRALLIRAPAELHYQLGFGESYGGR